MQIYTFENISDNFYASTEAYEKHKNNIFEKISVNKKTTIRKIFEKICNIPKEKQSFMYLNKNNEWTQTSSSCKKATLFIEKNWFDSFVKQYNEKHPEEFEKLPNLIILQQHEKFRDDQNNVIEIETRGKRIQDFIFFKIYDVQKGFGIDSLQKTLLDKRTKYKINKDYVCFENENLEKVFYLTYLGIIKIICNSRNKKCEHFQAWMQNVLFIHQLGSQKSKNKLAANLVGIDIKNFGFMLKNVCATSLPAIYLINIGHISDLIDIKNENTTINVFKYGFTENLERRCTEHRRKYGKLTGSDVCMYRFIYIDNNYLSEAKKTIRSNFLLSGSIPIEYNNEQELIGITLDSKGKKSITDCFNILFQKYGGKLKDMQNKHNIILEKEKNKIKHEYELKIQKIQFDYEIKQKEMQWKYEKEIEKLQREISDIKTKTKIEKLEHKIKFQCKKRKRDFDDDELDAELVDDQCAKKPALKKQKIDI